MNRDKRSMARGTHTIPHPSAATLQHSHHPPFLLVPAQAAHPGLLHENPDNYGLRSDDTPHNDR